MAWKCLANNIDNPCLSQYASRILSQWEEPGGMGQQKVNPLPKTRVRRSRTRTRQQTDTPQGASLSYGSSFNNHVTSLQRLPTAQRQVAIQQIGQTQGNRYTNRLVETLQQSVSSPATVQRAAASQLNESQIARAKSWYKQRADLYTPQVIGQIQTQIGVKADQVVGPQTIEAIASWQHTNGLQPDGRAGDETILKMFGQDIRVASAPSAETLATETKTSTEAAAEDKQATETKQEVVNEAAAEGSWLDFLPDLDQIVDYMQKFVLFPSFGSSEGKAETPVAAAPTTPITEAPTTEVKTPVAAAPTSAGSSEEKSVVPPPPKKTKYKINYSPQTNSSEGFQTTLNNITLEKTLLDKMTNMANHALENDLVTGDIAFTYGMRSPSIAHKWSTAWSIREGKISLNTLKELENSAGEKGKDDDGNLWYKEGWTMSQAKANATSIWSGAQAAEGYPSGDTRKEPNNYSGVTRHATGKAIDAVFPWNDTGGVKDQAALDALKSTISTKYANNETKKNAALGTVDKFLNRGSYSEIAATTVAEYDLKRPLLHSASTEDWHYEEK